MFHQCRQVPTTTDGVVCGARCESREQALRDIFSDSSLAGADRTSILVLQHPSSSL